MSNEKPRSLADELKDLKGSYHAHSVMLEKLGYKNLTDLHHAYEEETGRKISPMQFDLRMKALSCGDRGLP